MFTGLIKHIGEILSTQDRYKSRILEIAHDLPDPPDQGASVAVNGVCLTVLDSDDQRFHAECYYSTMAKTTLISISAGNKVHLETALSLGSPLDGHLIQGHVNQTTSVLDYTKAGEGVCLSLALPVEEKHCFIPEGSIALDGVSLTISEIKEASFSIQLISETLENTLFANLKAGDLVNLETDFLLRRNDKSDSGEDAIGRDVSKGISWNKLKAWGYVKISVEEAAETLANGGMIILTDNEDRENEGDLVGAARHATPEMINFMATHARGLICCSLEKKLCDRVGIELLENSSGPSAIHGTRFCTSIDAIKDCTTGISAFDRSRTLKRLVAKDCQPNDFARPGHIFPILEAEGSLKARQGHTEASLYLTRLGGLEGAAVICEMMDRDGHMVRGQRINELSEEWKIGVLSVEEIIRHSKELATTSIALSIDQGDFHMEFLNTNDAKDHFCLYNQENPSQHPDGPLVRIHSECLTGDVFGSNRCDCGPQLKVALRMIEEENGYLIYLRQEGRGIGLRAKIQAYKLQDKGMDTIDANLHMGYPADSRDYSMASDFLRQKGIERIRLLTNNPDKVKQLENANIKVSRIPHKVGQNSKNEYYIKTKQKKMGHLLT